MSDIPKIINIDLNLNAEEFRDMRDVELEQYEEVLADAENYIMQHNEKVSKKEAAIGKLVALGLSEEEIRAMGL